MVFTRGLIDDQLGLVLIDGGRDKNLIACRVVSKLGLQSQPHPAPYIFQSPYETKSSTVVSQVVVEFSIGQYKDQIMCDVVYNLPSSIVLGQPWFRARQVCFASRRSKKFRIRSRNKVFVVNPLTPEAAADDLSELNRIQKEYQQALLKKTSTWRSNPAKTQVGAGRLCSSPVKQSPHSVYKSDEVRANLIKEAMADVFLDGKGRTNDESEVSEIPEDARIEPLTRTAQACSAFTEQSTNRALVGRATRHDSNLPTAVETFKTNRGILPIFWIDSNTTNVKDQHLARFPCFVPRKQNEDSALVGRPTGDESNYGHDSESFFQTPESSKVNQLELIIPGIEDLIRAKPPLFVKNTADKAPLLGRANQLDWRKFNPSNPFMEVQGTCSIHQFDAKRIEQQTPNFQLKILGFQNLKTANGGKGKFDDSSTMVMNRDWGMVQSFNWKPGEERGVVQLDWKSSKRKPPIHSSKNRYAEEVRQPGKFFDRVQVKLIVEEGSVRVQEDLPTTLQASKSIKQIVVEVEVVEILQKRMFEQPSFDPIWDRFCDFFDKGKGQALRAKLFEEG
ncbi:unnamed protein product [Linum trigynum]|uniref:Uncharacterized protein n=1 Tax=Linum trigynum TaxID=586398 RepID=A0AAV2FT93_9ROSI